MFLSSTEGKSFFHRAKLPVKIILGKIGIDDYEDYMKHSRSELITIRGLRYHIRHWGNENAPLLVMLHGWMDTSASFQFMIDCLQHDWHVIAPDWRGFGRTELDGGRLHGNVLAQRPPIRIGRNHLGWIRKKPSRGVVARTTEPASASSNSPSSPHAGSRIVRNAHAYPI